MIFGKRGTWPVSMELSALDGITGFKIDGITAGDQSGFSVSSGDFNGDFISDLIIGAPYASTGGKTGAGETYVIFGDVAPIILNNKIAIKQGKTIILSRDQFDAIDENERDQNQLTFFITDLQHGQFSFVDQASISLNQFSKQQIAQNKVQFTHDGSIIPPSFNLLVRGSGIASIVGPKPANITFTSIVNHVPVISAVPKSGAEDTIITFTVEDFANHFSDIDGDSLIKVQITSLPTHGILKLSGVAVTLNQEITASFLTNLTFEPDANWNGQTSFSWKGYDGIAYSVDSANVDITITAESYGPDVEKIGEIVGGVLAAVGSIATVGGAILVAYKIHKRNVTTVRNHTFKEAVRRYLGFDEAKDFREVYSHEDTSIGKDYVDLMKAFMQKIQEGPNVLIASLNFSPDQNGDKYAKAIAEKIKEKCGGNKITIERLNEILPKTEVIEFAISEYASIMAAPEEQISQNRYASTASIALKQMK